MDLQIHGNRPPSARPQSRMNPITGEEMPHSARGERSHSRAGAHQEHSQPRDQTGGKSARTAVPPLQLGHLASKDDDYDADLTLHMDPYNYKLDSPGSTSTVSWGPGTPTSASQQKRMDNLLSYRDSHRSTESHKHRPKPAPSQPTAWDHQPVPDNLPPPSQRHQQQYAKMKEEIQESYRQKSSRSITESEVDRKIEQLQLDVPVYAAPDIDEDRDQLQKGWTSQPYTKAAHLRREDKQSLEEQNRQKKLIETVMIDQLSRAAISCPEVPMSARTPTSSRGLRGRGHSSSYRQHEGRAAMTGLATENLLSRRVQFGARVVSRNGKNAIKELTGFFFSVDNSLTVYEFKKFGKTAKALPFISRGRYHHLKGPQKGNTFSINDIKQGNSLWFETASQPLPESMTAKKTVTLMVTFVDDDAKANLLFEGVPPHAQDEVWKRAHIPKSKAEIDAKILQVQVQESIRSQISKRGIKVFTGIYNQLRRADDNGDGMINKVELEKALLDFHMDIEQEHFDDLWEILDEDCTNFMAFEDFIRGFLGQMSEKRKLFVFKAFLKIDTTKQGQVAFDEINKFYNAHRHPQVVRNEFTEEEVLQNFFSHFQHTAIPKVISFYEFENYYEGLSVCVESEEDFAKILQNAWGI